MAAYSGGDGKYTKKDVKHAAEDIKTWLHGFIQIFCATIIYGRLGRYLAFTFLHSDILNPQVLAHFFQLS